MPAAVSGLNVRSSLPVESFLKLDELITVCSTFVPDVVCLVETRLSPNVLCSDEVSISDYSFISQLFFVRQDRNIHGGGVAMYVHETISYTTCSVRSYWVRAPFFMLTRNTLRHCLSVFFRCPSSNTLFVYVAPCFP